MYQTFITHNAVNLGEKQHIGLIPYSLYDFIPNNSIIFNPRTKHYGFVIYNHFVFL